MNAERRNLAQQLADCRTPRECVRLMRLLEDTHAREVDELQAALSSLRTEHGEIVNQLSLIVKVVEAHDKKLSDPMDSEQAMDDSTYLPTAPPASNGQPASVQTIADPPPHGVVVGAVWRKLPYKNKASGEATIAVIDQRNQKIRFTFDKSWMKQRRGVSFTTLDRDWELVQLPPDVPNISAWVLDRLDEAPADAQELVDRSAGLTYKSRPMTKGQIGATFSSLAKQDYVARLDAAGKHGITDVGRDELRQRTCIMVLLRGSGPLSVDEMCRLLHTHFGITVGRSSVNSSLNSLAYSQLVERYEDSWRAIG